MVIDEQGNIINTKYGYNLHMMPNGTMLTNGLKIFWMNAKLLQQYDKQMQQEYHQLTI